MIYTVILLSIIVWGISGILATIFLCKAAEHGANETISKSIKYYNIMDKLEFVQGLSLLVATIGVLMSVLLW